MVKGTEIASAIVILAGLSVCFYPLASGYLDSVPVLDNRWDMAHTALLILGGILVAFGVGLEYRAQEVELSRVTRSRKKGRKAGKGATSRIPNIRDAFVTGWGLSSMLLLPIGVAFYYMEMSTKFEGLRPSHTILFGFYLAGIIALPVALQFTKMAIRPGKRTSGRSGR
jgi:hypothetical protein